MSSCHAWERGPIVVLEYPGERGGGMNKEQHISQVLNAHLKGFYNQMELERSGVFFQQDIAPSYTAKLMKTWFTNNEVAPCPTHQILVLIPSSQFGMSSRNLSEPGHTFLHLFHNSFLQFMMPGTGYHRRTLISTSGPCLKKCRLS